MLSVMGLRRSVRRLHTFSHGEPNHGFSLTFGVTADGLDDVCIVDPDAIGLVRGCVAKFVGGEGQRVNLRLP